VSIVHGVEYDTWHSIWDDAEQTQRESQPSKNSVPTLYVMFPALHTSSPTGSVTAEATIKESIESNHNKLTVPPDHLILDRSPNIGPPISRWELDKFKNCWNKSFKTSKILTLLYQQSSNLLISQRDMSGPRLGALSNNMWSRGTDLFEPHRRTRSSGPSNWRGRDAREKDAATVVAVRALEAITAGVHWPTGYGRRRAARRARYRPVLLAPAHLLAAGT
jgi:hypothetical protein